MKSTYERSADTVALTRAESRRLQTNAQLVASFSLHRQTREADVRCVLPSETPPSTRPEQATPRAIVPDLTRKEGKEIAEKRLLRGCTTMPATSRVARWYSFPGASGIVGVTNSKGSWIARGIVKLPARLESWLVFGETPV